MAGPLTEVTIGFKLPKSPLAALMAEHPHCRLVLLPISGNGTQPPERYLVSVHALQAEPGRLKDALASLLSDIEVMDGDLRGVATFTARLDGELRQRINECLATGLEGIGGDVIHRPVVLAGRQVYCSLITTQAGPLEEGVRQLIAFLHERGLHARVLRLGPHRPSHSPGAYDEGLTEKQSEFLRLALALGLYDTPRRITLESIASIFGISKAAAHNRMRCAERKILHEYFDM